MKKQRKFQYFTLCDNRVKYWKSLLCCRTLSFAFVHNNVFWVVILHKVQYTSYTVALLATL